jgi:hypothetical protein
MNLLYNETIDRKTMIKTRLVYGFQIFIIFALIILPYGTFRGGLYKIWFVLIPISIGYILIICSLALVNKMFYPGIPVQIYSEGIRMPATWADRHILKENHFIFKKNIKEIYIDQKIEKKEKRSLLVIVDEQSNCHPSGYCKPNEKIDEMVKVLTEHYPEFPIEHIVNGVPVKSS